MNALDLQLTPTEALVDELCRRSLGIAFICHFRESWNDIAQLTRWSAEEYRALAMTVMLQQKIVRSMEARQERLSTSDSDLGDVAPDQDDGVSGD